MSTERVVLWDDAVLLGVHWGTLTFRLCAGRDENRSEQGQV